VKFRFLSSPCRAGQDRGGGGGGGRGETKRGARKETERGNREERGGEEMGEGG
jgi:hypothetical protein